MAFEKVGETLPGMETGADLSTHQFKFVTIDATGVVLASAGGTVAGVLQNKPGLAQAAAVYGPGSVSKVFSGGAVAVGADVTPDASGRAVTSATTNYIAGKALTAAANANEIISVWITQPGRTP